MKSSDECQQPSRTGSAGQQRADSLPGGLRESKLPERHGRYLWQCVDQLALIERQRAQLERELKRVLLAQPLFAEAAADPQQLPRRGPGHLRATVLAEIGDFSRFTYRSRRSPATAASTPARSIQPTSSGLGTSPNGGRATCAGFLVQAAWTARSASIRMSNGSGCGSVAKPGKRRPRSIRRSAPITVDVESGPHRSGVSRTRRGLNKEQKEQPVSKGNRGSTARL